MRSLLLVLLLMLNLACTNESSIKSEPYPPSNYELVAEDVVADYEIVEGVSTSDFRESPTPSEDYQQKLIKESYLRFETQDLDKTYNKIMSFVKQNNGYVQSDNSSKNYNTVSRNLTIRIPTNNFEKTVDSIENNVRFFDEKRISSKDVTEEFIDLEARLKAKRTLEKRYLDLLSKAKNVKEILEIERELSKIREEIESKQGRLKYLENKVSLSTLNIEFYKVTSETGVTISYGTKMWNAIKSGFNGISSFFLGLLYIWPFILILIVAFFWVKRWFKKRKKNKS